MNTPSHLIMTAALRKRLRPLPIPRGAFLLGAVLPDVPLWLLSVGGGLYFRYGRGWSTEAVARHMFGTLYFEDPRWIAAHNLLHSPTLLTLMLFVLWRFRQRIDSPLRSLYWFLTACMLHTSVDILTHVDDGPLLFFPFEWTIRFHSPISYWDPAHHGRAFMFVELALDLALLLYLVVPPLQRRLRHHSGRPPFGASS